jgi:hypothetical protein
MERFPYLDYFSYLSHFLYTLYYLPLQQWIIRARVPHRIVSSVSDSGVRSPWVQASSVFFLVRFSLNFVVSIVSYCVHTRSLRHTLVPVSPRTPRSHPLLSIFIFDLVETPNSSSNSRTVRQTSIFLVEPLETSSNGSWTSPSSLGLVLQDIDHLAPFLWLCYTYHCPRLSVLVGFPTRVLYQRSRVT